MCGLCYKKLGAFQVLEMETPSRKRFQKFFHRKVKDVFQKFQSKNCNFSLKKYEKYIKSKNYVEKLLGALNE